ncbi:hypothetical protein EDC01DRAFT_626823 [Geopyxis carbonaria]|nr:hypothetical protein EDC01DRAFT_626823 [Geopyxis carbonaria]
MQAWHKSQKAKAIKKGKAATLKTRTEKLSKRDPQRLQRQVDAARALVASGDARPHDRKELERLEGELAAVERAREKLGLGGGGGEKRKRDGEEQRERRERLAGRGTAAGGESDSEDSDAGDIPLPPGPLPPLPGEPVPEVKTTYEAAPVLRDLRKEAAAFVPAAVQRRLDAQKAAAAPTDDGDEGAGDGEEGEGEGGMGTGVRVNAAPDVEMLDDEEAGGRRRS